MDEKEVKAVLEWLRDYLKWASSKIYNPVTILKMKRDLSKHKNEIYMAFREAVRDEFTDFAEIIGKAFGISETNGEAVREITKGGEDRGSTRSVERSENRDNEVSGGDENSSQKEDGKNDGENYDGNNNVSNKEVDNNG